MTNKCLLDEFASAYIEAFANGTPRATVKTDLYAHLGTSIQLLNERGSNMDSNTKAEIDHDREQDALARKMGSVARADMIEVELQISRASRHFMSGSRHDFDEITQHALEKQGLGEFFIRVINGTERDAYNEISKLRIILLESARETAFYQIQDKLAGEWVTWEALRDEYNNVIGA